jgi:D-alanyl-D-alanine carboxypeptidase/D-alanyl-D-alanine-endopeptidase (penicillin-binding protein 4)
MKWLPSLFLLALFTACSTRFHLKKELHRIETSLQEHAGFALYDPAKEKFILEHHSDRYFTPASNTKIFTLFTSLSILGDSVASIRYEERNDTLVFQGMGDPSFLYPQAHSNDTLLAFLRASKKPLAFSSANFATTRFGPGWAWDDYNDSYSPERSSFPIYGNLVEIKRDSSLSLRVQPALFRDSLVVQQGLKGVPEVERSPAGNRIMFRQTEVKQRQWAVPFHYSDALLLRLLSDTLHREVFLTRQRLSSNARTLRSIPADSLYRVLMQDSDNFIAEQLLLQCAALLSDTLQPEIAIRYAKKNLLTDLPDEPQWVDGSGLSRYNLFTPRSVVVLWDKMSRIVPRERLFKLLATGGRPGTIRNYFNAEVPYIFGKTGSLSNNHCLSGFVVTKSGRTLIFSFMHNNFVQPTRKVRLEMEKFLNRIHERY